MKQMALAVLVFLLGGCALTSKELAKNMAQKNLSGDGFFVLSQISVSDPETGSVTPEIKSVFVSGKLQTILKDANILLYDRKTSCAWYNAKNTTTTESLSISLPPAGNMAETVEKLSDLLSEQTETQTQSSAETDLK